MSGLAEEDLLEASWKRPVRVAGLALVVLAIVAALVFLIQGLGGQARGPGRQVTKITILPDPPPPPPPPKEAPKPEPQKSEPRDVKVDQPKPVEAPKPAPDPQIKMEGEAGEGDSPFGAGEVTTEYQGGDVGTGNGLQFAFYTNLLQRRIQDSLQQDPELKRTDFRVIVRVWLDAAGRLLRSELVGSTGDTDTDRALRTAMDEMPSVGEAPPANMPQPVTLRITNRVTG